MSNKKHRRSISIQILKCNQENPKLNCASDKETDNLFKILQFTVYN